MAHDEIRQHRNRLTFPRRMLIIQPDQPVLVDDQLQRFIVPAIRRILGAAAAMNELMAANVVTRLGCVVGGERYGLIETNQEERTLDGFHGSPIGCVQMGIGNGQLVAMLSGQGTDRWVGAVVGDDLLK